MSIQTPQILVADDSVNDVTPDWFCAEYWRKQEKIVGKSFGRSTTYFFKEGVNEFVLRHYYRGGLVQKISREHYLFLGLEKTRAWQELKLLQKLREYKLPVPKPVAAKVERRGLFYTNDIIIEKIDDAKDLFHILKEKSLSEEVWRKIGRCIRLFHDHHVFHADLNIHNIMLDADEKVWLIDFDRGEIRSDSAAWKTGNISRLRASFLKEKKKFADLNWSDKEWDLLLSAYRKN